MTRKIFIYSFLIGLSILMLCSVLFLSTVYGYYERDVYGQLAMEADYVSQGMELKGEAYLHLLQTDHRVTWVDNDGTVLYDNKADAATMENHLDRTEIQQALKSGTGESIHDSDTLLGKTIYYAQRMENGSVIRISCTQNTVSELMLSMVSPICWILLLALVLSGFFSYRLARRITGPINAIDLDYPDKACTYKELHPLITRLQEQNLTIHQQMNALSLKQREFSAITENMREGFLLVDHKTNILSGNHSAMHILGCEQQVNVNLRQSACNADLCRAVETALAGIRGEKILVIEDVSWQIIASPVVTNGQVTGAVVIVMDVTQREQLESLRREFSANVSHELKTPLTSISGFAELMRSGMVPAEKVQEFSEDIYRESQRLIQLVEDIIELSRLDENAKIFAEEPVDLYEMTDEILANLQPAAKKKHVTLQLTGVHASVTGVWQILNEMLYNLCDNAIKYNKDGGNVAVSVIQSGDQVQLSVSDTGIGIPYVHQSRVFERFYRVDKSHSKEIGGTGLGLSIVKHGVQYHNARMELKSEPGKGTTITIIF